MSNVLRSIDSLTPDWLTNTLRNNGTLPHGAVTTIEQTSTRHQASLNYFLSVSYSNDAPATAPQKLFIKFSRPERLPLNDAEVNYYTQVAAAMPNPPTPKHYDAQFDPEHGAYHILMEDVSATHGENAFPLPPTVAHAEKMIDELARLHAFWWQHPRLSELAWMPTPEVLERYVRHCEVGLQPMIDFMGDRLTPKERYSIETVFAKHSALMAQRAAKGDLTLIHGDAHTGNFLLPHSPEDRAYLVDRQPFDWSLTCWLGVNDIAYMIVHWWYPERRRALEKPLLQRYLRMLHEHGIKDYTWEQLWDDYRLCAMQSFYVAVAWCRYPSPAQNTWLWYSQLQKTLTAFDDLACAELLDNN